MKYLLDSQHMVYCHHHHRQSICSVHGRTNKRYIKLLTLILTVTFRIARTIRSLEFTICQPIMFDTYYQQGVNKMGRAIQLDWMKCCTIFQPATLTHSRNNQHNNIICGLRI